VIQANCDRGADDHFLAEIARLSNPDITVIVDLSCRYHLDHAIDRGYPFPFHALAAPSEYVASHPAVAAERLPVYVMPYSVDTDAFHRDAVPPSTQCERWLGTGGAVGTAAPVVVFGMCSRWSAQKGVGLFAEAASVVHRMLPHTRFVLVGSAGHPKQQGGVMQLLQSLNMSHDAV
jgi:glycosyltransferase involved in cell wall biosynthesis